MVRVLLEQIVECLSCFEEFDVVFETPSYVRDPEDLVEAPAMSVSCPACTHVFEAEYSGWHTNNEA